jgi:hypothetical protein
VTDPEVVTTFFSSGSIRVMAELRLSAMFALRALADLSVPFVRTSLEVDGAPEWTSPPVFGSFGLAGAGDFL